MQRWWPGTVGTAGLCLTAAGLTVVAVVLVAVVVPSGAGASGPAGFSVRVSPAKGLVDDQTVTVTGRDLPKSPTGAAETWFVTECTAEVHGRMNPSTDTPHCDLTAAQAVKVTKADGFSARFRVVTGIVGDGYCGTPGHLTCVIGVSTAAGQGTVVPITFRSPPVPATPTTQGAAAGRATSPTTSK